MGPPDVLGWHWLVDFHQCAYIPDDPSELEEILIAAAQLAGATVVQCCFHRFSPFGLSGVVVIAESHLAIHTWPEHQTICIDLFSCSEKINAQIAIDWIASKIQAKEIISKTFLRGQRD